MSKSDQIRQWMTANPGKHFMGCITEGVGVEGKQASLLANIVSRMAVRGTLTVTGKRGTRRYERGRPARKYTTRAG